MRKLIVTEFVTLDGVMEAPGGEPTHPHTGWVFDFMGPEQMEFKLQEVLEADAHLIGRVTYESFAGAWPQRTGEFAEKVNSMPKYVVTTTLDELAWNNSTRRPRLGQAPLPRVAREDHAGARRHKNLRDRGPGAHRPAGRPRAAGRVGTVRGVVIRVRAWPSGFTTSVGRAVSARSRSSPKSRRSTRTGRGASSG